MIAVLGLEEAKLNGFEIEQAMTTCRFIRSAVSAGYAFASHQGKVIVAYDRAIHPGPGHVLLDATADITGLVILLDDNDTESVDVPTVDFSNLEIVHVAQPNEFAFVGRVVEKERTAKPYADWIRETVLQHTQPGDDVLLVVHKGLLVHGYIERAEEPE